ncbi:MAG: M56 family metallopeptidase [Polyangia bacterium]
MNGALLAGALGCLVTYGVHAAIAAVVAEVVVRLARPSPADEHRLWKMALALPLVTACVAVLFGGSALGRTLLPAWATLTRIPGSRPVATASAPFLSPLLGPRAVLLAALAATVGVVGGAARFAVGFARLRRRLRDRHTSVDPRLASALARISARFAVGDVELTESAHLATPAALGARTVCFPAGSTASLTDVEVEAVLAHELAHLERRDPAWFFFAGLVEGALWMQPFNRRVVARLRRSAELACDERAVAATGDALGLARGLSLFAHAAQAVPAWADAHPAFGGAAAGTHALVDRVRRLADPEPAAHPAARRFQAAAAILVLVVIGSAKLSVTFAAPARAATTGPVSGPEALGLAAASRRAAFLASEEFRLQAELTAAQVVAERASTGAGPSHLLELEQDLRHVRQERAWLERTVNTAGRP